MILQPYIAVIFSVGRMDKCSYQTSADSRFAFCSVLQFAGAQSELSRSAMRYDILWVVGASLASDSVRERYCIDNPVDDVEKCECCREDTS